MEFAQNLLKNKKLTITVIIVLFAFFIRFYRLSEPNSWSFDEVYHALSAESYALSDSSGYEWWHKNPKDLAYEWLHPPLGKIFMASSIYIFDKAYIPQAKADELSHRTTFAWRLPGVIFAALTVLLLIKFGERLFSSYWVGAVAGLLYALDGMSFVQSRTAMNDIYIAFFVLLAFYRLFIFLSEYPHKSTSNLLWLGVSSGLAAATKWTGFYAVLVVFIWGVVYVFKKRGLKFLLISTLAAIVFYSVEIFGSLAVSAELGWAKVIHAGLLDFSRSINEGLGLIEMTKSIGAFPNLPIRVLGIIIALFIAWLTLIYKNTRKWKVVVVTLVSLSVVPVFVYIISYSQWFMINSQKGHPPTYSVRKFKELHDQIWWYQTRLTATHDYQSKAHTWPLLVRPVWFYVKYDDVFKEGVKELHIGNIYTMGNPFIWWAGIAGVLFSLWTLLKKRATYLVLKLQLGKEEALQVLSKYKKILGSSHTGSRDKALLLVLVGYFSMFLPWVMSPRIMFLYHYLPSVPFLILALSYLLHRIFRMGRTGKYVVYGYLLVTILVFFYFYPHWSAVLIPQKWVDWYFWLPTWK